MNIKKRTSKEWKGIIEDWTNSSLTPKEYCKRHGLKVLSFNPWKRKLYPFATKREDIKEKWDAIVKDWEGSGLNIRVYCKKKGLELPIFIYWKNKYSYLSDREHFPKEKWEFFIVDWKSSGLNREEYCMQNGLILSIFCEWEKRIDLSSYEERLLPTQKKWEEIIRDWEHSSLTPKEYCKETNLNLYTFRSWKRKISPSSSRKRRTLKKWEEIIRDWEHSSLTPKEYCKETNLNLYTFRSWKRKISPSSAEERHILAQKKWENIIEGCKNSGLSSKEYCRQMDLKVSTFYNWKIKIYHTKNEERLLPTKKKWKGIIEDWQRSDLNQNEYCRRKGFKPSTFANWKRSEEHT